MGVKVGVFLLYLLSFSAVNGYSAGDYFSDDPISVDESNSNDEFYQINRIPQTTAKSSADPFSDYIELLYYVPLWRDLDSKNSEGYRIQKRSPNRKKRSISKRTVDDEVHKTFDGDGLPSMHDVESVKTIEFSSLFSPRFGMKRNSVAEPTSAYGKNSDASNLDILRNQAAAYFDPRNWFRSGLGGGKKGYSKKQLNPRLGRSIDQNTVQVAAGSAFTPRLGRSSGNPTAVRLNAGNMFTPRLGRSENHREVQLSAGSAFTPRLGRSDNYREVQMSAGSAFTPRLGRSDSPREIQLSAGDAFTPRLGRSDNSREVQLSAGDAFTPRLGRSDNSREVQLSAGSAFTPRLGRSGNPTAVRLNAGNVFTPRLGRSDNSRGVQLSAGSAFTPRLGRSENSREVQMTAGSAFTPRLGRSDNPTAVRLTSGRVFTPRLGRSDNEEADLGQSYSEDAFTSRSEGWNVMR